ncbi:CAP domain-containing protein [Alphaproteobacteria bacterium KMM 3653]|uniref:CAP domain-containing protein n=1 Tax=Harenicola maris TaxID=2841044 RepID=A0AAP2CKN8_9RHOB|nr:CAP domain-containing protein [Harenicola maris]
MTYFAPLPALILCCITAVFGFAPPVSASGVERDLVWQASNQAGFAGLLNRHRARYGLSAVRRSYDLDAAARAHAVYMVSTKDLSHRGAGGSRLPHRLQARGLRACLGGENLGRGQRSEGRIFSDWVASPSHNRILLMQGVTHYGLARVGDYWAMVVARPC